MSTLREELEERRRSLKDHLVRLLLPLKEKLTVIRRVEDDLAEVELLLAVYDKKAAKKPQVRSEAKKPTCTGCYYVPRDSREGEPSGGCDECRQGPHYR